MLSEIYWIPLAGTPELAIMARPRAGDWLEDEIAHWKNAGVQTVVSLLEDGEVIDLGLEAERSLCTKSGINFVSFPIPDRGFPDEAAAKDLAEEIAASGNATAIHCRAGIGRSSIVAALVMMRRGFGPAESLDAIQNARRVPVPDTDEQRRWLLTLDD